MYPLTSNFMMFTNIIWKETANIWECKVHNNANILPISVNGSDWQISSKMNTIIEMLIVEKRHLACDL